MPKSTKKFNIKGCVVVRLVYYGNQEVGGEPLLAKTT